MSLRTLPPDGRSRSAAGTLARWATHADTLRANPGQWLLLEVDEAATTAHYLRNGQPDFAALAPDVEVRTRNTTHVGSRVRGELWARYTPGVPADNSPERRRILTDAQIRAMRETYAAGEASTTELARRYGVSQAFAHMVVSGQRRAAAGGPIHQARP